jgi:hypothetical protein
MDMLARVNDLFKQYSVKMEAVPEEEKPKEEEPAKTEMAEIALEDGTLVMTDAESFDVGASVFVLDPDGTQIPLPSGDYTLADGRKMIIVDGVITEMVSAEAPAPAEEAPAVAEAMSAVTRDEVENMIVKAVESVVQTQMSKIAELEKTVDQQKTVIAKLSKQPSLARQKEVEPVQDVDVTRLKGIALVQALQNQFV